MAVITNKAKAFKYCAGTSFGRSISRQMPDLVKNENQINYLIFSYGVDVHGIDLSTNMNGISLEYRLQMEPEVKHRCNFYIEDADKMEFPENFFDVVYRSDIFEFTHLGPPYKTY